MIIGDGWRKVLLIIFSH